MKKLLMTIAVVLLMAVPAMADDPGDNEGIVNVYLTVESYIRVQNLPIDGDVVVTLHDGQNTGSAPFWFWVVSNDPTPSVDAEITATGSVGTWSVDTPTPTTKVLDPGVTEYLVTATVADVDPSKGPQADVKEAEVTITVALTL